MYSFPFLFPHLITPLRPAFGTAKGHAPVLWLCNFYKSSAVPAVKSPIHRLGFPPFCFGMLPIQPLAVGRAELRPLIFFVSHADDFAAAQAAKCPQNLSFSRNRLMDIRPMPIGPQPAGRAAIFLCRPARRKFLTADRTNRRPFHNVAAQHIASPHHERYGLKKARKKDSLHRLSVCCLPYVSITGYTYPCVCVLKKILRVNPYPPPGIKFVHSAVPWKYYMDSLPHCVHPIHLLSSILGS